MSLLIVLLVFWSFFFSFKEAVTTMSSRVGKSTASRSCIRCVIDVSDVVF